MNQCRSAWLRIIATLALVSGILSCAGGPQTAQAPVEVRDAKPPAGRQADLPSIVAVMPFGNDTQEKGAAERMRKAVYNFFSSAPYVDVELASVDEALVRLERSSGASAAGASPQEVCRAIGCDGLLFGRVSDYQRAYAGVYSRLRAEAEIWLVDARTGRELARVTQAVEHHGGGLPLTPLGAIMSALSAAANTGVVQENRMVAELAEKLVDKLPVRADAPAVRRPAIKELITNVAEGPFGSGKILRVGLEGEPGAVGSFDIGNFRKGLPLRETQPGVYLGEYAVLPGDNTRDMPIIAYLRRASGPESQWIDTSGLVAVDTAAPDRVSNLRARGGRDRIDLSWEHAHAAADLSGYRVLRSEQPLSGYQQIGRSERMTYEDRTARADVVYYYRVVASDRAGNDSEASPTASARLVTRGPLLLSGELSADAVLSGIYILKGSLTVPRGISLTIGPETTIVAEKDASIRVQGKLLIDGANGLVRLYSRRAEKWAGITSEGGHLTIKGAILSGAEVAVAIKAGSGAMESTSVTDNGVGVRISGLSGMVVTNCWVGGNRIGVQLAGTDAKILQSSIVRNGTGISLRDFTGEVSDNIVADNDQNVSSDVPVKLDSNYIGQRRVRDTPHYARLR